MKREEQDFVIKRYQLEHLVPLALTILSVYFWVVFFDSSLLKIIGGIINVVGLVVWWSAKLTLGENWSAGYGKPGIKKLVTHGIYSKIRHPLYWGINITLAGLVLLYPVIWFFVTSLAIIIYFFYRMRIEDDYLLKTLGEEYKNYKNKTWL